MYISSIPFPQIKKIATCFVFVKHKEFLLFACFLMELGIFWPLKCNLA